MRNTMTLDDALKSESYRNKMIAMVKFKYANSSLVVDVESFAQDVVQEAFIKIYLNKDKFTPGTNLNAWISRAVINKSIDNVRKLKKRENVVSLETEHQDVIMARLLSPYTINHELKRNSQEYAFLYKAIEKLTPDQQELIRLRIFEEYSFKQIAEIQQCSVNTCLGRMRYALINLRKIAPAFNLEKHFNNLHDDTIY